jgi:hypothetical protein
VAVVSLPARGRPPQAAARRVGLEVVEKLLTSKSSIVGLLALVDVDARSYRLCQLHPAPSRSRLVLVPSPLPLMEPVWSGHGA